MPSRMNHVYSRRMPQSGKPPGPVRSKPSFSSRTYCWSFFQLSSRRASTFAMNASRSDCAFTGRLVMANPRQSRARSCLDRMADLGSRRLLGGGGFRWIPAVNDLAVRNSHDDFRGGQARWRRGKDVVAEDDDVGEHVAGEDALALLVERGPGAVAAVDLDGAAERQALGGDPAALWQAVLGGARHRNVQADLWIEGHHRPVAAERQRTLGLRDAVPQPAAAGALGTDVGAPDVAGCGAWRGVHRLERGSHAEPAETRHVGGIDRLDVLDAMAAAPLGQRTILCRGLVGIQRHAHRGVA